MSGTSLDGVDVAVLDTDGERIVGFGPAGYRPYSAAERAVLRAALAAGPGVARRDDRSGVLAEAEALVTGTHAEAVEDLLDEHAIPGASIDLVGFHGQTVIHKPRDRLTVQIGDAAGLARRLGLPVVHDFRAADVAGGGQGAPMVPVFHRALAGQADLEPPVAILNIGGVANVTYVARDRSMLAFDTGPGNALLDDLMRARVGAPFDRNGEVARRGRAQQDIVARLLDFPFFAETPPKSLDRNAFQTMALQAVAGLSTEDAAATLVAFTARSVARARDHVPEPPRQWIVAGGGARNLATMAALIEELDAPVRTAEDVGWSIDALEAQAFAFLAVRSAMGLPLTFPSTTGIAEALTGGTVAHPNGAAPILPRPPAFFLGGLAAE